MSITDRERLLLWQLMEFNINRYLMSNTVGRENGFEKSEMHIRLIKTMMSYLNCVPVKDDMIITEFFDELHEATRELTDNLDKIGLPLDDTRPDYDQLAKLFFDEFICICVDVYDNWMF